MAFKPLLFFKLISVNGARIDHPLFRKVLFQLFIMLASAVTFPLTSTASAPVISEISLHRKGKELFFSATLKDGITREIKQLIVSGAPMTFRYFITLKMKRKGWIDKTVGRITVVKALKYDLFKKVYRASEMTKGKGKIYKGSTGNVWRPSDNRSITGLPGAISWISELRHVYLLNSDRIKPSREYYIQVRADLRTTNLWVPFNYILFFLSFWDVDTGWAFSNTFSSDTPGAGR